MSFERQRATSACNRFGLGARPGELAAIDDARAWLLEQATRPVEIPAGPLPPSSDYLVREQAFRRERAMRRAASPGTGAKKANTSLRDIFGADLRAEAGARWHLAAASPHGFQERMVRFWSNHFAVSVDKNDASLYAMPMEREAIRPHAFGRFGDLLLAVETHPAMLRYLDNAQSVGPESLFAERAERRLQKQGKNRRTGLNENLAREILELHTLGVDGGYRQDDVVELARAITGWGLPLPRELDGAAPSSAFEFHAAAHEPGTRTLLGRRYAQGGLEQGRTMLADLAVHPATAKHVSLKLARHFVADAPDPALVARMARAWLDHGGDIARVCAAMIGSDAAWNASARKFKSPQDFVVSALRATGAEVEPLRLSQLAAQLDRLGQPELKPRSPAGFPDTAAAWLEGDALWKRVQVATSLAEHAGADAALAASAGDALGVALDEETATAIRRAGSPTEALATLFAAPAFQWRT